MKYITTYGIFYSSIKSGERVFCLDHNERLVTLVLNKDKLWTDNVFDATIVCSQTKSDVETPSGLSMNRREVNWCADAFFTFHDYPCDDDTLTG